MQPSSNPQPAPAQVREQFVGEDIQPDTATLDVRRMAIGEPGLPHRFTWRGSLIQVAAVRRAWRETGSCRHGSGEQYVRKHWYEVEDPGGRILKVYFERTPRRGQRGGRWRLYSIAAPGWPSPQDGIPTHRGPPESTDQI